MKPSNQKQRKSLKSLIPSWLTRETIILLLVAVVFLGISLWSEPLPQTTKASRTPQITTPQATTTGETDNRATPLPQEWLENREQTSGIILASVILVLIIVGGTLSVMGRKPYPPDDGQPPIDPQEKKS